MIPNRNFSVKSTLRCFPGIFRQNFIHKSRKNALFSRIFSLVHWVLKLDIKTRPSEKMEELYGPLDGIFGTQIPSCVIMLERYFYTMVDN